MRRTAAYAAVAAASLAPFAGPAPLAASALAAVAAYRIGEDSIYSPEFQRRTAWILLALAVLEALTGFGAGPSTSNLIYATSGGLLTRGLSLELHLLLITPTALFFLLHIASGVGLALYKRGVKSKLVYEWALPALLAASFALTAYLDSMYFSPKSLFS